MSAKDYDDFKCDAKDLNNKDICRWSKRCLGDGPFHALVLDGPSVGTSKALINDNLSTPTMILAPQCNENDAKEMEKRNKCKVIRGVLSDVVRSEETSDLEKISIFNLDFMGSIFGRQRSGSKREIYPLSDFHDCLRKTKQEKIVISITVSDRLGCKLTRGDKYFKGRSDFGKQIHKDFLEPIINFNQYTVIKRKIRPYRRVKGSRDVNPTAKMWFILYYLVKDIRNDPNTIDFAMDPDEPRRLLGFNPEFDDSWLGDFY